MKFGNLFEGDLNEMQNFGESENHNSVQIYGAFENHFINQI